VVCWLCCFGTCDEAACHGGEHVVEHSCPLHGSWEMRDEQEITGIPSTPSVACSHLPKAPPPGAPHARDGP
jgi:hypothetical protein